MKLLVIIFLCLFLTGTVYANHLKGGWIQYEYLGPGSAANTSQYRITVRQYLDCNSTAAQRDAAVYLGIYDGTKLYTTLTIARQGFDKPDKTTYSPCISSPPPVCYYIDRYVALVDLPDNTGGYTLTVQRCCRITGIVNVSGNSNTIGISYTNKIPGMIGGVSYANNNSPVFAQKDTAIVCYSSPFTFDFSATDKDGDDIVYHFCDGLIGGDNGAAGSQPNPPTAPPYISVAYSTAFSGVSPMGTSVTIDPQTGIISGIAPAITGDYVVSVCADEYRNGVFIGSTKKEIHIKVANCSISAAALQPSYISCNGTTLTFQNESPNSTVSSYLWDFGVPGMTTDTSTKSNPTFDYLLSGKDSGTYIVKLTVASTGGCKDSATTRVSIYPGFKPDFTITGSCFLNPFTFKDATTTKYGSLISWKWDFGDNTTLTDTAHSKDSSWKYPASEATRVTLTVANSKGCSDTVSKSLFIPDKPSLNLAFKDTLICSNDRLVLIAATSGGSITWTPSDGNTSPAKILGSNTRSPSVFPTDTTRYYVHLNDNGCTNDDTVTVNVLQYISVELGPDLRNCAGDTISLKTVSEALGYQWTSSTGEIVQNIKKPIVQPVTDTRYYVLANLGHCEARDTVTVKVFPYPVASLGRDTTICFGNRVQLRATFQGAAFTWTPTVTLTNENTLTPLAGPSKTTTYIFAASDTLGCSKISSDTIVITVIAPIIANAGKDTTILPDMRLQLHASEGTHYLWSPATGLSAIDIPDPVVQLGADIDSVIYKVTVSIAGCSATDDIVVRVYKKGPDIIVPSAFTPNGDAKNDVARPITIGISRLHFFTIYSRWGEPLFTTAEIGKGWDGVYKGTPQPSGTYVYKAEGEDYLGQIVSRKGTLVLIR